jgi:hypothetical protein
VRVEYKGRGRWKRKRREKQLKRGVRKSERGRGEVDE